MKKVAFFFLVQCIAIIGYSQTFTIKDIASLSDLMTFESNKTNGAIGLQLDQIDGTPYLIDEFINGEVIINDSIQINDVPLRYNIYGDRMQFKTPQEQVLEIDNSQRPYRFILGGMTYTNFGYLKDGQSEIGIFKKLADGELSLYKKYLVVFEPETKAIGYKEGQPDRFVRKDDSYYLKEGEGQPELILNSKDLLEKLSKIKPEIMRYVKTNKIRLHKEKHLIQLVEYCNN